MNRTKGKIRFSTRDAGIGIFTVLALATLLMVGWPQFVVAYIGCGLRQPVIASPGSEFAGGTSISYYFTPGDEVFYKPAFDSIYFCSEQQAKDDGSRPDPLSKSRNREIVP